MKMHNMLPFRGFWVQILLLGLCIPAQAQLVQTHCSSQNTGSDFSAVTDIYQSNGLCYDTCLSQYAFAVVQWQSCWCTNIAPGITTSVSDCNEDCPGYPAEQCGNRGSGLFGYIALKNSPSGTAAGSSTRPTSTRQSATTAPSSTQIPVTSIVSVSVSVTVTQSAQVSISTVTPTRSSTTTTSTESSTTSSSSSTSMRPITSVIMTTISGAIVTQTVTSTPVVAPELNNEGQSSDQGGGISGGAIAGIVIGVLAALAAIAAAAFLLWRRRKATNESGGEAPLPSAGDKRLGRNVSVLSKAGLLNGHRPSMGETRDEYFGTQATGQNSVRHSLMFGPGMAAGVDPSSPLGSSHGSDQTRRTSKPMVYDQRLNPSALFANAEANGSRVSMQDQQDYSRPLGVTNPDPRPSFESRISKA